MMKRQRISCALILMFMEVLSLSAHQVEIPRDHTMVCQRPPVNERLFISDIIEKKIVEMKNKLKDRPYLAWLFENCFPNTLDTTVHFNGADDTFVYTGDIHAMWLRDSGAQVWPYVPFAKYDEKLKKLIRGVILRQLKCINIDPYANAFNREPDGSGWTKDNTTMTPWVYERKYEIDSLGYPIRLAYEYWKQTGDASIFQTKEWKKAVRNILKTFREQQRKDGVGPYRFLRETDRALDTVQNNGYGHPAKPCGLIASFFRPSDDATCFPFLIPSNFFAVSILHKLANIEKQYGDKAISEQAEALADEVSEALQRNAIYHHPKYGAIYAYEVDGFGNHLLMDDANVPSLLALPYISDVTLDDPIYQNTRRFVLSEDNPYFFCSTNPVVTDDGRSITFEGIGGPHIGYDYIWPMSILLRAMTSTDSQEINYCLDMIQYSDGGTGFMHESFHKNNPAQFTRKWFAWANTLYGELILKLFD